MKFVIFTLIPLILSMGITPIIPFSDAVESNQICIDKVWIENTKGWKLNFKIYFILPIIFTSVLIPTVFADEQVPATVIFVEGDPFYFSEGDLGIKILKFFERPLT